MTAQAQLRQSWNGSVDGRLCGREQAKAWALREVWRSEGKRDYGLFEFVASRIRKTRDGQPIGDHPSTAAVLQLFQKMDDDPEWLSGKHSDKKRGRKRVIIGGKLTAIRSAAKRLKREGTDPTYAAAVAACPNATLNPGTKEPVDKHDLHGIPCVLF